MILNYENVKQIYSGRKMSRYMRGWIYAQIEEKMKMFLEENRVYFRPSSPTYKSQRCSECGWVHKSNRKGREFFCVKCGASLNADLNASKNHEIELPPISERFRKLELNKTLGFYWRLEGLFNEDGEELEVPLSRNEVKVL